MTTKNLFATGEERNANRARRKAALKLADGDERKADRILELAALEQNMASLSDPVGEEGEMTLEDFVEDKKSPTPEQLKQQDMVKALITKELAKFPEREQAIIKMRFGIDCPQEYTLEEVGAQFNITRERIRQIEAKTLRILRKRMAHFEDAC